MKRFYEAYYNPANAKVVVTGDVTAQAGGIRSRLPDPVAGAAPTLGISSPGGSRPSQASIWWTSRGPQSVIRIGRRAMAFDTTGRLFHRQPDELQPGWQLNSRINLNLREDKGYTYGASSGFRPTARRGSRPAPMCAPMRPWMPSASSSRRWTATARAGRPRWSWPYMRSAVSQQDALSYETLGQKAGFLLQMIMYDLKPDYVQAQNNLIKTVSPETLKASAARWLIRPRW